MPDRGGVARPRARRGEGDRLREEILVAAERLLVQTGDEEAVTVRVVAGAVGVAPAAIYKHFEDKTELVYAVCQRTFARLDEAIEAAAAGASGPLEELRERGKAYVRFGVENPEHYRILFMTRPSAAPADWDHDAIMGSAAFDHHLAAVTRAVEGGSLPEGTDPFLVAVGLWVAVHGITSLRIAMPTFPWPPLDELVDHVLATQARGLGAARADG